jgi:hypothetical protein
LSQERGRFAESQKEKREGKLEPGTRQVRGKSKRKMRRITGARNAAGSQKVKKKKEKENLSQERGRFAETQSK